MRNNPRKSEYLGCIAYNESGAELGQPAGFWWFEDEDQLWETYHRSELLNAAFSRLGSPTFSEIIWVIDRDNFIVFQILVISAHAIHLRQYQLMEQAVQWLRQQSYDLNADELGIAGLPRDVLSFLLDDKTIQVSVEDTDLHPKLE